MSALETALQDVVSGRTLRPEAMSAAMLEVMDGDASPVRLAAFLTALRVRGETDDEVLGAALALRERAARITLRAERVLDTCGTGGDRSGTFNISTASAFVAAAAGVTVAKHGNRAVSSLVGSADVLEALGVVIGLPPEDVRAVIDDLGIGFLFAPAHHGALRHAAPVRRELGFRTVLNLVGPLSNPAGATHQLVGVYDRSRLRQVASVLGRLGARRALAVHASDGLDEVTLSGPTFAALWDGDGLTDLVLDPALLGLPRAPVEALRGGTAEENAATLRRVLSGEPGPALDVVRLNAAAALWVAEAAPDLETALSLATEAVESGRALAKLEALVRKTRELAA